MCDAYSDDLDKELDSTQPADPLDIGESVEEDPLLLVAFVRPYDLVAERLGVPRGLLSRSSDTTTYMTGLVVHNDLHFDNNPRNRSDSDAWTIQYSRLREVFNRPFMFYSKGDP